MFKKIISTALLATVALCGYTQSSLTVDFNTVTKEGVRKGASSANLCWLLDSDKHRPNKTQSMASALQEVGVGALRFPYGHLANNYLWHTPPYNDTKKGLRPAVAAKGTIPGEWDWAVAKDGSFKSAMDFDEYIDLCESQGIAPLVVVNCMSHKYAGGPTVAELAECAAEWVRYAQKKRYKVRYWQIGNEMDHHPKIISMEEYVDVYVEIASAMKAVDPSVQIAPGILGKANYLTAVYNRAPELVDFTTAHQYMWKFIEENKTYDKWSVANTNYIPNIEKMQEAVDKTDKKDMEILITETGVSPSNKGMGNINNTYKSLWWFEVLMREMSVRNVSYIFFWGTHSPWKGEFDDENDDIALWFRVDDNSRKPTAEISRFVNANLRNDFVETTCDDSSLRLFAMSDSDKQSGSIFVMNKLKTPKKVTISMEGLPSSVKTMTTQSVGGKNPYSRTLEYAKSQTARVENGVIEVTIPALSVVNLSY
ncbi:MAG: glycoside hydrolase family 44 protein [Rikenellaceae bacterium]